MALLTVFSNNLDSQNGSLTNRFTNATAFYIDAPLLGAELEIDVYLQVYFPTVGGERLRNLRIGSLKSGVIKLNETDTETVVPIPNEFLDSGLEMALYFTPSESIFLEVYVLGTEVTLSSLDLKITAILDNLETIGSEDFADNLLQFAIDNLLPILIQNLLPGVGVAVTGAITDLILPAITNALPSGNSVALPASTSNIALNGSRAGFTTNSTATNNTSNLRFT